MDPETAARLAAWILFSALGGVVIGILATFIGMPFWQTSAVGAAFIAVHWWPPK